MKEKDVKLILRMLKQIYYNQKSVTKLDFGVLKELEDRITQSRRGTN